MKNERKITMITMEVIVPLLAEFLQESEEKVVEKVNQAYQMLKIGYSMYSVRAAAGLSYRFLSRLFFGGVQSFPQLGKEKDINATEFGDEKLLREILTVIEPYRGKKLTEEILSQLTNQLADRKTPKIVIRMAACGLFTPSAPIMEVEADEREAWNLYQALVFGLKEISMLTGISELGQLQMQWHQEGKIVRVKIHEHAVKHQYFPLQAYRNHIRVCREAIEEKKTFEEMQLCQTLFSSAWRTFESFLTGSYNSGLAAVEMLYDSPTRFTNRKREEIICHCLSDNLEISTEEIVKKIPEDLSHGAPGGVRDQIERIRREGCNKLSFYKDNDGNYFFCSPCIRRKLDERFDKEKPLVAEDEGLMEEIPAAHLQGITNLLASILDEPKQEDALSYIDNPGFFAGNTEYDAQVALIYELAQQLKLKVSDAGNAIAANAALVSERRAILKAKNELLRNTAAKFKEEADSATDP